MSTFKEKMMAKKIKKFEEENKVLKQNAKNHSDVVDYWRNENKKLKEKGKCHKDKRITVRSCDDRAEYNRQVMHLKAYPECKFIPERKWTKKSKDQPLESS